MTNTLRSFSISLIGLFIPIYIFQIAEKFPTITENSVINSIFYVLLFYLIRSAATIGFMPRVVNVIFGYLKFNGSIMIANVLLGIAIYLLILAETHIWALVFAPILLALNTTLYWIPFHTYFVRNFKSATGHFGTNTGIRLFLAGIATAAGPALGGIVVKNFGFQSLFWLGIVALILSGFPILFGLPEHNHGKHNVMQIVKKYFFDAKHKYNTIAQMCMGIDGELYAIFSPLLLFLISSDITNVGYITSISVSLAAVFTLVVGKVVDKQGPKKIHKVGLIFNSFFYLPRVFLNQSWLLYLIDVFDKINGSFLAVPLLAATYERAKTNENESDFMIYREFMIHLGICLAIVLLMFIILLTANWRLVFLLLAIVSPLTYLVNVKNSKQ